MNLYVILSGVNPLVHYAEVGAARRADPPPLSAPAGDLDQNPDVAALAIDPLEDYLLHGSAEGRWPRLPAPDFASAQPVTAARIECRKDPTVKKKSPCS